MLAHRGSVTLSNLRLISRNRSINSEGILKPIKQDVIFLVFILALGLYYIVKNSLLGSPFISLLLGLLCFIFVPGYYLTKVVRSKIGKLDALGYSFIFGIMLEILQVTFYSILSIFTVVDFTVIQLVGTICLVIFLKIIAYKFCISFNAYAIKEDLAESKRNPIIFILAAAIIFRLYFSSFNTGTIMPDASLYLDSARTLVSKGVFSSNIIWDENLLSLTSTGLLEHASFTFIVASFFEISTASMTIALFAIGLIGSFLIYPLSDFSKQFFGKTVGIIVAAIIAIQPLFVYFSATLFGPEISGLLFLFTALYILIRGVKSRSAFVLFISGVLFGISEEIWWSQFFIFVAFIPIFFAIFIDEQHSPRRLCLSLIISGIIVLAYAFALKIYSLYFIYVPIVMAELIALLIVSFKNRIQTVTTSIIRQVNLVLWLVTGLIISTIVSVIRHYILPSSVSSVAQGAIDAGLVPRIFNAFTSFLKASSLSGVFDYSKYLSEYASILIVLLFFLAFLFTRKISSKILLSSIILLDCILISLTPPPSYPLYLSSEGRYFLLPVSLMIIVASTFLVEIVKMSYPPIRSVIIKIGKKAKTHKIPIATAVILLPILFSLFFIPQYTANLQSISDANTIEKNGWSNNLLGWLKNNTSLQDVVLTSRARELAWFTNRQTVSIANIQESAINISYNRIDQLSKKYNCTYLVADSYLYWTLPELRDLYLPRNTSIGTVKLSEDDLISYLTNGSIEGYSYKLVYFEALNESQVCVWKILPSADITFTSNYEDFSASNLVIGNNGSKVLTRDNSLQIIIGKNQSYAYSYSRSALNLTLDENSVQFFAWNVTNLQGVKIARVELWREGQHFTDITPPSVTGIWVETLNLQRIDDLRIVISGNPSGSLTIKWLAIGSYSVE